MTYPLRASVGLGQGLGLGQALDDSGGPLMAFTIFHFANPGWGLVPWNVTVIASAEKVSVSSVPRPAPSIVYANAAPNFATSKYLVPAPTSSSGLKPTRKRPCGVGGRPSRYPADAP